MKEWINKNVGTDLTFSEKVVLGVQVMLFVWSVAYMTGVVVGAVVIILK